MSSGSDDQAGDQIQAVVHEVLDNQLLPSHLSGSVHRALPLLSEERRRQSLNDSGFPSANRLDKQPDFEQRSDTVLYLAYGSNLSAETFRGRRGIEPLAQINVIVPSIVLTFDLPGFAYMEPCFANVRYRGNSEAPAKDDSTVGEDTPLLGGSIGRPRYHKERWQKGLVGVVYEVSRKDYATIIRTEGGGSSYQDIVVDCYPLLDASIVPEKPVTAAFRAHTLYAPAESPEGADSTAGTLTRLKRPGHSYAQASSRYMKLLTSGADEHNLPQEYQTYLHQIRSYTITTMGQRVGKFIFVSIWAPIIFSIFGLERMVADKKTGRSPKWLRTLSALAFSGAWVSYDRFFKPLFGDGERTLGDRADREQGYRAGDEKTSMVLGGAKADSG